MISPLYLLARDTANCRTCQSGRPDTQVSLLTFDLPVPVEPITTIMGSLGGVLAIVVMLRMNPLGKRNITSRFLAPDHHV